METIEKNGKTYTVEIESDDFQDSPWDREDGHGDVSEWTRRKKLPGERVLCEDRGLFRYYDFQDAVKTAKRDGWAPNMAAYEAFQNGEKTRGQLAHEAVESDFNRLQRWCAGDWGYVGVIVTEMCECCGSQKTDKSASLWGIESDCVDYIHEVANELAEEI
jgi:hypothetical protein